MESHAPLEDDASFLLARASALSVQAGNAALVPHGLRVRSFSVLALAAGSESPTQRDLAEYLRLDPSQVVALVDELEARGWATRTSDAEDRRTKTVRATAAGREILAAAGRDIRRAEEAVHGALTIDERQTLTGLLRKLAFPERLV